MTDTQSTLNVGVIGLGMMGQTHLDAYSKLSNVNILAVADMDPDKLSGKAGAQGNIEGQAQGGFDLAAPDLRKYRDGLELIADSDIDVVDICVPTPGHMPVGLASLQAGKHTLIEKPLARTHEQALQLADAAEEAWDRHGAVSMCAMCMRFWPGWDWLKDAVVNQTYGKVLAATFRRVASFPGGPFYSNGEASGGAILDLHIHDADFVRHLFGEPEGVQAEGYTKITEQPDHVLATYRFPTGTPGLADEAFVAAEGGWAMSDTFGFSMRYTVNFENATADFDLARGDQPLLLHEKTETTAIELSAGMGYDHELAYFLDHVRQRKQADRVTLRDAAQTVRLIESELDALQTPLATP